jgi:hypothetical protein
MSYMVNKLRSMNLLFPLFLLVGSAFAAGPAHPRETAMTQPAPTFTVIELRRYTIKEGRRDDFARYFETWFPEAFQQLGALALGQFTEPRVPDRFTWIRGFRDMDARAVANGAFYFGPVWKEHRQQLNELIVDSDDVLLLRPLDPEHAVSVLAAVDPVREPAGAQGVVVAQLFPLQPASAQAFARAAAPALAAYRAAGARDAGLLVTLDAPNNFPQLPVRTDGPYLVWLGLFEDMDAVEGRFLPVAKQAAAQLAAGDLLRGQPSLLILRPGSRSRLRWLPQQATADGTAR